MAGGREIDMGADTKMPKPGDFFLSIVTFIGVLLPGAVFVFLHGESLRRALGLPILDQQWRWLAGAVAAYMVGHILLTFSQVLNRFAESVSGILHPGLPEQIQRERANYYGTISGLKTINPLKARQGNSFKFHEALSSVRLQDANAAAEIDSHMADYKLLRNLVVVFVIDSVWSLWSHAIGHALGALGLALLAFLGFACMHAWAELLAFQYARLLHERDSATRAVGFDQEAAQG
jgi:hypothetical protein